MGCPKWVKNSWRETIGVKVRSETLSPRQNFLFWPIWCDVPGWHSARNFTSVVRIMFLPRIFYSFWTPPGRKLRIGLFDQRATKWRFRPACNQNLDSVLLRCDYGSNFRNFDLYRLWTFTPMVPKVSLQDFLLILGAPRPKISNWSFWPLCDPKWCFSPACDQNWGSVLLSVA